MLSRPRPRNSKGTYKLRASSTSCCNRHVSNYKQPSEIIRSRFNSTATTSRNWPRSPAKGRSSTTNSSTIRNCPSCRNNFIKRKTWLDIGRTGPRCMLILRRRSLFGLATRREDSGTRAAPLNCGSPTKWAKAEYAPTKMKNYLFWALSRNPTTCTPWSTPISKMPSTVMN